jgi:hypothetical protein
MRGMTFLRLARFGSIGALLLAACGGGGDAASTGGAGGSGNGGGDSGGIWHPKPGTTWQWQITGKVDTTFDVDVYDVDLFDAVPSARTYTVKGFGDVHVPRGANPGIVDTLHGQHKKVICYVDSGAFESYRPDESLFPHAVIGNQTYASNGAPWKGERWLDIEKKAWPKFLPIIEARFDLAKSIGCDAVEPDENNPIGNDPGFPITKADQKTYYLEIASIAHARGLSVGMKNGIETTDADTIAAFDWNLNEECNRYSECGVLDGFVKAGKAVFQCEYVEDGETTAKFCDKDKAHRFDGLLKKLALGAWHEACP